MSVSGGALSRLGTRPCTVLVVDDDRRVRELLETALSSSGFRVITAGDGEEALLRAQRDHPDLVLLDVRLPKRSGLEVCDALRNDPTDPSIPIILVSAVSGSDHRLQGFLRGADDYLAKPFSPRELIARIRRLIARAAETRAALRRARELEQELSSARREARRAGEDARREEALRDLADGMGRDLLRELHLETLLSQVLASVQSRTHADTTAMLLAAPSEPWLEPWAIRGDRFHRVAGLRIASDGGLATLLAGLARPMLRSELDRFVDLAADAAPLVAGRWDLVVPLVTPERLEGVVLVQEPSDVPDPASGGRTGLRVLGDVAAIAVRNARAALALASRSLDELAAERYPEVEVARATAAARALLDDCGRALELTPFEREHALHALALSPGGPGDPARRALVAIVDADPSGLAAATLRAWDQAGEQRHADAPPATALLATLLVYRDARASGATAGEALERALRGLRDTEVGECLTAHVERLTDRDAA